MSARKNANQSSPRWLRSEAGCFLSNATAVSILQIAQKAQKRKRSSIQLRHVQLASSIASLLKITTLQQVGSAQQCGQWSSNNVCWNFQKIILETSFPFEPVGTLIAENWHPDLEQFRPRYKCRPAPRVLALSSRPLFQASRRTFLRLL